MTRAKLAALMVRFQVVGIMKGTGIGAELLLRPADALRFIDALGEAGIGVLGVDGWRYVDNASGPVQQDLGVDYSVPEHILLGPQSVHRSAAAAKAFISDKLPAETPFVVVVPDTPAS